MDFFLLLKNNNNNNNKTFTHTYYPNKNTKQNTHTYYPNKQQQKKNKSTHTGVAVGAGPDGLLLLPRQVTRRMIFIIF
jgi:hypothetical protein